MAEVDFTRQQVRLPHDVKLFLAQQASLNCSSENSEIVRSVRARMETQKRGRNEDARSG
ncbi:hypothetical protein ABIE89_006444 [Bradyrhizobium niftali]